MRPCTSIVSFLCSLNFKNSLALFRYSICLIYCKLIAMKHLIYIFGIVMLVSCSSNKTYTEQETKAYQRLKELVASKKLEIQSNFARPMATSAFTQVANSGVLGVGNTASNIDISNNSNELKIQGDSISGYFPFFGEQQFGGGYPGSNHQGIEFNNIPENYTVTENDAKQSVQIQFAISDEYRNNEHYRVFITLFPNNRSTIQINSSNRTPIEFSGRLQQLTPEDKKSQ